MNTKNNQQQNIIQYKPKTIMDYVNIVMNYWKTVLIIFIVIFGLATVYALTAKNIYKADTTLKVSPPEGNILEAPLLGDLGSGSQADRFIANEIHTMSNITIREKVAEVIIDSFKSIHETDKFSLLLNKKLFAESEGEIKSDKSIVELLKKSVKITQVPKLDFIEISCESPSPFEAALIVNAYANVYREFNLLENRKQVSRIKEFLEDRKNEKYAELKNSENDYKIYQLRGGAIELDAQAKSLIETMTELESREQSVAIDLAISKQTLEQYKSELKRQDLSVSKYLESKANEPILIKLQEQIAEIEAQKELANVNAKKSSVKRDIVKQYEEKIATLKSALLEKTTEYQNTVLAASPEEIKRLTQMIFEEEVKYNSLKASHDQLNKYLKDYVNRFDKLPERSIDLARLERQRLADEKLYMLLEEKYQEALINEQATSGSVLILNAARIPEGPSAPSRLRILIIGLSLGLGLGLAYSIVRNLFDKSIKSPDDLDDFNIETLTWIPEIENIDKNDKSSELVVLNSKESVASDAFKSLRTIIRYAKVDTEAKAILITSSAPSEGKSLVSVNLAASFAQTKQKTVIIDCDLRKPRVHSMLGISRVPGFTDYLVAKCKYEDIIKKTSIPDLHFIPAGTIPPNPTEMLDSKGMRTFMKRIRSEFDLIIIDSPPLVTLADSIILSRLVDETVLVVMANQTNIDLIQKSVEQLKRIEEPTFIGVLLNKFNLKNNYGSYYYKYAYTYSRNGSDKNNGKAKRTKAGENKKVVSKN